MIYNVEYAFHTLCLFVRLDSKNKDKRVVEQKNKKTLYHSITNVGKSTKVSNICASIKFEMFVSMWVSVKA